MTSQFKTLLLLAALSGLIIVIGGMAGGRTGIIIAFIIAMVMNVGSYWFSDSIVLKMYHARELAYDEAPALHDMVEELARNAGIPKPKVCVVPEQAPNAFATGRDPNHAVVAVTEGIMQILTLRELRGVIAHEIAHIAHRDILIQSVAAVMGSTIVMLANMLQFSAIFGGNSEDRPNPLAAILMAILAPIAATLIQMAISRSREYLADQGGATYSRDPLALAQALNKLQQAATRVPMQSGNPSTAEMFIVAPLFPSSVAKLFSTHPPIEERVARLTQMAGASPAQAGSFTQPGNQFGSNQFGEAPADTRGSSAGKNRFGDL